jgi:hypothetical protein
MIIRISLGNWEGSPTVLAEYDTGRMRAWEYQEDKWVSVHAADIATKAAVLTRPLFDRMFPDVGLPPLIE